MTHSSHTLYDYCNASSPSNERQVKRSRLYKLWLAYLYITGWYLIFLSRLLNSPKRKQYVFTCLGVTALIAIAQPILIGLVYKGTQAVDLLESLKESSLYLGSAIATASATVLALMLTLLSLTSQVDTKFDRSTYKGIKVIGDISTATFVGSVALLVLLSLPIGEFEAINGRWYEGLYYTLATLNGVLSGLTIVGVLVLSDTLKTLIKSLAPDDDE